MKNIEYVEGSFELLEHVKPLWQELNRHHKANAKFFADRFDNITFEKRHEKFASSNNIMIELVKDTSSNTYIGYCISTITEDLIGEVDSLYLKNEYRKFGIGDVLMTRTLNWLNDHEVKSKTIGVAEGNEIVLDFYKRYNFFPKRIILEEIIK